MELCLISRFTVRICVCQASVKPYTELWVYCILYAAMHLYIRTYIRMYKCMAAYNTPYVVSLVCLGSYEYDISCSRHNMANVYDLLVEGHLLRSN